MPKRKRMEEEEFMSNVLHSFGNLAESAQDRLLCSILEKCNKRQLATLANIIMPQLKLDILRNLPYEISIHILGFLPVVSLCRLASASKYHRNLVNDSLIWKNLCKKYEYDVPLLNCFSTSSLKYPSALALAHNNTMDCATVFSTNSSCPSPPRSSSFSSIDAEDSFMAENMPSLSPSYSQVFDYKSFFKSQFSLRRNWTTGKYKKSSFTSEPFAIVTCLQFNEEILVVATDNSAYGMIEVLDVKQGRLIRKLTGHEGGVWALEFKGNVLVSGGCDRDLRIWNLSTGTCIHRLRGHTSTVRCLKMLSESIVVTGSRDNTLRVWNTHTGVCLNVLIGHTGSVRCLDFYGNIVVSGSYDNTIRIWDITDGICKHVLTGHHAQIYSVVFDGTFICSGSLDADIRVWNPATGQCTMTLEGHEALVGHMQLKDRRLVSGGSDGRICVWDLDTGRLVHRISAHRNSVTTLQFDDYRIISGGEDGIKLWNLNDGSFVRHLVQKVTGVWRLMFDDTKLVTAVQRGEGTSIEIMNFSPEIDELN